MGENRLLPLASPGCSGLLRARRLSRQDRDNLAARPASIPLVHRGERESRVYSDGRTLCRGDGG